VLNNKQSPLAYVEIEEFLLNEKLKLYCDFVKDAAYKV
jgi:hypothetical protein